MDCKVDAKFLRELRYSLASQALCTEEAQLPIVKEHTGAELISVYIQ
ncbi:hypothetical protein [Bacillus massilioanorexius]|nr:hypothetical protein [Bacillus massilioanorexius]